MTTLQKTTELKPQWKRWEELTVEEMNQWQGINAFNFFLEVANLAPWLPLNVVADLTLYLIRLTQKHPTDKHEVMLDHYNSWYNDRLFGSSKRSNREQLKEFRHCHTVFLYSCAFHETFNEETLKSSLREPWEQDSIIEFLTAIQNIEPDWSVNSDGIDDFTEFNEETQKYQIKKDRVTSFTSPVGDVANLHRRPKKLSEEEILIAVDMKSKLPMIKD